MKLVILGGGASGMAAAIEAARTNAHIDITITERLDRLGKKILATGNGRCNFSNTNVSVDNYYGNDSNFTAWCLKRFTVNDTVNFFNQLGVFPKEEEKGRLYPFSGQASAVLDCLRNEVSRLGIEVITGFHAETVSKGKKSFKIQASDRRVLYADKLIIAGGGCASPALGSDGSCFEIFKTLGHRVSELAPALVQMKTDTKAIKGLQGIKIDGMLRLIQKDIIIAEDKGEILFTDYGISGPPVFQLSAKLPFKENITASIDFMPEYSPKEIYDILEYRQGRLSHTTMENYFTGLLNKRAGNLIARRAGVEKLSHKIKELDRQLLWSMVSVIKDYRLEIRGTKGFNNAQVTAGGVLTADFDYKTMESKIVKGLYACGEVLDIYGDCGGYNLQWAWSSGRLAGKSAAESMKQGEYSNA